MRILLSRSQRSVVALAVGAVCGTASWLLLRASPPSAQGADFTFTWLAARGLLAGVDPYAFVHQSRTPPWADRWFYPLPAAFVGLPFAWLPVRVAAALFVGFECAILAYFVTRGGYWRLMLFASAPMFQVCWSPQWSPLMTAAALAPPLLAVLACKPTLALPLLAYQRSLRALLIAAAGIAALLIVSLVIEAHWPRSWVATLRSTGLASQYRIPMFTTWAPLLVLPALRWRRPEARLLLGMALVPQNMFFYEQLPLLLVPETRRELFLASTASIVAYSVPFLFHFGPMDIVGRSAAFTPLVMLGMYAPAVAILLKRRNAHQVER